MRENILDAGEGRVDQKIAALKQLQTQIQALLAQRDAKQDKQIASLVKTYSAMKPKDAARIFDTLADDVLIPVAKDMKSDVLAPVLAAMNPDAAQKLTVKLAALLKLPEHRRPRDRRPLRRRRRRRCRRRPAPRRSDDSVGHAADRAPLQTAALAPPPATVSPFRQRPRRHVSGSSTPAATPATPAAAAPPPKPRKPVARKPAPTSQRLPATTAPAATAYRACDRPRHAGQARLRRPAQYRATCQAGRTPPLQRRRAKPVASDVRHGARQQPASTAAGDQPSGPPAAAHADRTPTGG